MKRFRPRGPRGAMLLGFAAVSLSLGTAYITEERDALDWLNETISTVFLGWAWVLLGGWLAVAAFRKRQAIALGAFSGLCFLWGTMYLIAMVHDAAQEMDSTTYPIAFIFYGMTIACGAAVRMGNPVKLPPDLRVENLYRRQKDDG